MRCGTLSVQPLIFRLVRRNGLIASDHALRKTHVGRAANTEAKSTQIFRDDTLAEHDRAFFLKVRDVVEAAVSETTFLQVAQKLQRPGEVVEVLANRYTVNDTERAGTMRHLIVEGDLTAYGNGQRRHALLVERRRLRPSARKPAALRDFCPLTEVLPSPGAASRLPGHFFGCQQCRRLHRRSLGGSTCGDHGSR